MFSIKQAQTHVKKRSSEGGAARRRRRSLMHSKKGRKVPQEEQSQPNCPPHRQAGPVTMEGSRKELGRLMAYNNPHAWAVPDTDGMAHRYFFLDEHTVSQEGDTPLLRLLALHACPKTIQNFLHHSQSSLRRRRRRGQPHTPPPPEAPLRLDDDDDHHVRTDNETERLQQVILRSNCRGVSPLHVALHRNSWHVGGIVRLLLAIDPTLVRRRMTDGGSYPLHVAMANNLTVRSEVLDDVLAADPTIVYKEDVNGDNPVSLLYKNVLRFRWARDWERQGRTPESICGDSSWMTVITPEQYAKLSLSMIRAASVQQKQQQQQDGRNHTSNVTWRDVCSFPRCPPLLIRVLRKMQEGSRLLMQADDQGRLPLHHAAQAKAISNVAIPELVLMDSVSTLEVVLDLQPQAALVSDRYGNCPLHYAVRNPTIPSPVVGRLLQRSPVEALVTPDRFTGLFPFQQAAATTRRHECPSADDDDSWASEAVSLVYDLLRSEPSAAALIVTA